MAVFFVAVTIVPLVIAIVGLHAQVSGQLRARAEAQLAAVRVAALGLIDARTQRASHLATELASELAVSGGPPLSAAFARLDTTVVERWLREMRTSRASGEADVVLVAGPGGDVLAMQGFPPSFAFADGSIPPRPEVLARAAPGRETVPGVLLDVGEVRAQGGTAEALCYVVVGLWTDDRMLDELPLHDRREGAAVVSGGRVLATRGDLPHLLSGRLPASGHVVEGAVQGQPVLVTVAALTGDGTSALVLWVPMDTQGPPLAWLLVGGSAVVAWAVGWLFAGSLAGSVHRVFVSSEPTRDEMRRSLSRLGQTLSSSLDLSQTLSSVVENAMGALAADQAVLMLLTPERDALFAKVGRGVGSAVPRLRVGQGLAGWVAATGSPLLLPADAGHTPPAALGEPTGPHQLLVPLPGRGQVIGVLSLLRDDEARPFLQDDLDTMTSFVAQASVAIENVLLHREAQRLAVTDPLTGLWNFRHFQTQADREVSSAQRFDRPLSLVILDLDHFKAINDGLGHQVGDEVLGEVARRIRASTRVPDVVARYGGEEFVVLLPGTGRSGAIVTAERIRSALDSVPVMVHTDGRADSACPALLPITCSVGVSSFPVHGRTLEALLRSADAAMYVAKTQGRNRVVAAGDAACDEVYSHSAPEGVGD